MAGSQLGAQTDSFWGLPGEIHGILLDRWREEIEWAELVFRCFTFRDQSRRANLLDRGERSRTAIFASIKRRSSDQSLSGPLLMKEFR
jgi:hypothetical protein